MSPYLGLGGAERQEVVKETPPSAELPELSADGPGGWWADREPASGDDGTGREGCCERNASEALC